MDKLDEIFDERILPEKRRELWLEVFIEQGLIRSGGIRYKAAEILGYSVRGLRDLLKKFPRLQNKYEFSTMEGEDAYQQRKFAYLATIASYWLPSRRDAVEKELKRIARECGISEDQI